MKIYISIIFIILSVSCKMNNEETKLNGNNYSFYVGTYTDGESEGIYRYLLQNDGVMKRIGLAAKANNPSYMAKSADERFVVAVSEINRDSVGEIESFLIVGDTLKSISKSSSGGAHPCFVSVNKNGFVLAANYTGGNVGLLRLNNEGELSPLLDLQQHTGSGGTERQKGPHAHSAWFDPSDNNIISIDLGTNELWLSQLDTELQKLIPADPKKISMNHGAGPRHLVFHPNGKWIYVVNELDCTVTLVKKTEDGKYTKSGSISTLPAEYSEHSTCADIHISSDGKFLYASNRGHNSIAIYNVDGDNGSIKIIGHELTRGDSPRNFSLSPDEKYLLVANQNTNNIVSFKRDLSNGLLEYVSQVEAPKPVCILF